MKLILIRHCESFKNINEKFDSDNNQDDLTPEGKKQVLQLITFLSKKYACFDNSLVFSGPRKRNVLTAEPIRLALNIPLRMDNRIISIDSGNLQGLSDADAWGQYPELMKTRVQFQQNLVDGYKINFPDGQSVMDFEDKNYKFIVEISENLRSINFVLTISHRSFITSCLNIAEKIFSGKKKHDYFRYYPTPAICIYEIDFLSCTISYFGGIDQWGRV